MPASLTTTSMPSTNRLYLQALERNLGRICSAPHCSVHRHHLNAWCRGCLDRANRYGDPTAGPLRRSSWSSYRTAVHRLFDLNMGHPGLIEAISWASAWMAKSASDSLAYPGAQEVGRLVAAGITPRQLIEEVAAVSMYLHECPFLLPTDKARDFALARAAWNLAPRRARVTYAGGRKLRTYDRPSRGSLIHVGKLLRAQLAGVCLQARIGVEELARLKSRTAEEIDAARKAPFATA